VSATVQLTTVRCRDGMEVRIEPEATERRGVSADCSEPPYEIWLSLYDEGAIVSSSSVPVPDLTATTIRAAAYGYAEGWDQAPDPAPGDEGLRGRRRA
jgi:hypothetical protein